MAKETYKCAHCLNTYEKGWTDEEAKKEAEDTFGKHPDDWQDDALVVCDDCYQAMLPSNHPDEVAEAKKHI